MRSSQAQADDRDRWSDGADARRRLLAGIPVTERRLELAGVGTAVLEGGDGPPVVLLHSSGEFAALWMRVLPDLVRTGRVVAPDLPGHGASATPDGPLDADRVLAWLGELVGRTCPSPPTLVGRGLGGAIAARFAAANGDRVERLVLVNSFGLGPFDPEPAFGLALHRFTEQPSEETRDGLFRQCFVDLDGLRERVGQDWEALAAYALDRARSDAMAEALGGLLPQLGLPEISPAELARIAVPTTLIWGRHDLQVRLGVAEAASARHGWPLHVIEDAGDDPSLEQPAAVLDALRGALATVGSEQVGDLEARVEGRLLRAGDPGWGDATRIWNGMAASTPALVLRAASAGDVAAAVGFARDHGLLLGVKGGGHNIAGTSMAEGGLTLDLSGLREVTVDPDARLAHAGPGCLLADVDQATQEHGLATPLGFISEVGVAGLTVGGGLGYLTRRFGWTVDNLQEVEIVTADGQIRRASREEHADLFWALRGGGGNFGVVTRFTFRLHEVGPTVYGGLIAWPFERAAEILEAYRALTTRAPRELAVWLILLQAPPAPFVPSQWHGRRICAMAVCYSGDLDQVDEALAPIRALGGPVVDLLAAQPYTQVQSYLDDGEPKGHHYYWKTEYLAGLDDELLATMRELFADCPVPGAEIGLLHLEGALNERAGDDGAVGNRDARYVVGVNGMWEPGEPDADGFRRWIRDAWERVRAFSTGASYVNFQTADEDDERVRASYGANLDRLVEVKRRYDPGNLFRANRNIRP